MNQRKQEIWRKYNFSDGELSARCGSVLRMAMDRDKQELTAFGLDYDKVVSLTWRNLKLFDEFDTDEKYTGDLGIVTDSKDTARKSLDASVQRLMSAVAKTHAPKTGHYRRFGTRRITDKRDNDLLFLARRIPKVHEQMKGVLSAVEPRHLDDVRLAVVEFERLLNQVADRVSDRDISTERRIQLGNGIYEAMMQICGTAKAAFQNDSPARYAEYLQYESNAEAKRKGKAGDGAKPVG